MVDGAVGNDEVFCRMNWNIYSTLLYIEGVFRADTYSFNAIIIYSLD